MQISNEQICEEFKELFYDWACKDLSAGIKNKANYLVSLGLLSYIEFLGSLLTGDVGFKANNKHNFDTAIQLFPQQYINLNNSISIEDIDGVVKKGLYSIVRCGLVHEYGTKGLGGVINNHAGYTTNHPTGDVGSESGIYLVKIKYKDAIQIDNNRLLYDFKKVLDIVYEKLQDNLSPEIENFKNAFDKLNAYKLVSL